MQRIRVLVICSPLMDSVGARTRMFREMEHLANDPQIELGVLWWAGWPDRASADRQKWIKQTRSQWHWKSWVVYPLTTGPSDKITSALSAIWRMAPVLAVLMTWRPRVIHAHEAVVARRVVQLARILGIRSVTDLHGAFPEELTFGKAASVRIQDAERAESLVVRHSDAIVCVSDRMVQHLTGKYGIRENKCQVIPCCVPNLVVGVNPETRRSLRDQMGLTNQTVLAYSGGTAPYQCVSQMCDLFSRLSQQLPDLFWLILTWSAPEKFSNELEHLGIPTDRYRILSLPQAQIHAYLTACDTALLLRQDHILNQVSSPTKFAEYLAAGLPVIISPYVGDSSAWVRDHDLGLVVELPPETDVPSVIQFLGRASTEREAYAKRCMKFVTSHLTWTSRAAVFREAYGLEG